MQYFTWKIEFVSNIMIVAYHVYLFKVSQFDLVLIFWPTSFSYSTNKYLKYNTGLKRNNLPIWKLTLFENFFLSSLSRNKHESRILKFYWPFTCWKDLTFRFLSNDFAEVRHEKHLHRNRLSGMEFTTEANVQVKFQRIMYLNFITFFSVIFISFAEVASLPNMWQGLFSVKL